MKVTDAQLGLWMNSPEWWTAGATVLLALITATLAYYTYQLWCANKTLVEETQRASRDEASGMSDSIAQATRASSAMEEIAVAMKRNSELMSEMLAKQMRAYVQVNMGKWATQRGNVVFGSWPEIVNVGLTPARNVSYRATADIKDPSLMGRDYVYPQPEQNFENDATLNPRQVFTIMTKMKHHFDPAEVETILKGQTKRLFVWGIITYDDVFGGHHQTRFSHNYIFYETPHPDTGEPTMNANSYYSAGHNDST